MNTKYNTDIKSSFLACRLCTPFAWTSNIIMNIVLLWSSYSPCISLHRLSSLHWTRRSWMVSAKPVSHCPSYAWLWHCLSTSISGELEYTLLPSLTCRTLWMIEIVLNIIECLYLSFCQRKLQTIVEMVRILKRGLNSILDSTWTKAEFYIGQYCKNRLSSGLIQD